ncbi:MAG: hypothetical protein AAF914_11480 [Pseudomonadota bacterium]
MGTIMGREAAAAVFAVWAMPTRSPVRPPRWRYAGTGAPYMAGLPKPIARFVDVAAGSAG